MRRFSYIFILFAMLFCGCNDNATDLGDEQIVVPTKPYIYLDAAVNTRASLVTGTTLRRNFSVIGYTYDFNNKWTTYRVTAKPNVFDNTPQNVTYSGGNYKYDPVKEWQGGKYTFFAFYPQTVNSSGANVEGTPYLTYAPDFNDAGSHIDIMTAMFEDTSLSSSPYVYFDFYHRLSAVDVVAMNFYEHSYDDPNSENTVITEKITIDIVDLALQFEGVQYKEAKIYMDRRIASECTPNDAGTNPYYQIITEDDESGIFINYNEDATLRPITTTLRSSMIFIPQENTDLKVTTTVSYMKRRPNGEFLIDEEDGDTVFTQTIDTPFNQPLKEGSRYYLQMTFTSSAVSISIITSDEWDDIKVDYEFE
ncbi:MAG: fimbrillin family protein [Alistipes sp.]|nr:fimbrillin family protein [Alistipes sp.]